MIEQTPIDPTVLCKLIGSLPPGRARKKYEDLLTETTIGASLGTVLCKGASRDHMNEAGGVSSFRRFTLIVNKVEVVPSPIALTSWITVVDPPRFVEATVEDLAAYVDDKNRGSSHWADDLLDEKLQYLRLCGVNAEIRETQ
jgi:hypothetical protein